MVTSAPNPPGKKQIRVPGWRPPAAGSALLRGEFWQASWVAAAFDARTVRAGPPPLFPSRSFPEASLPDQPKFWVVHSPEAI
jgi:hypothetical protein